MRRMRKLGGVFLALALCLTLLPVPAARAAEDSEAAAPWDGETVDTGWYTGHESELTYTISDAADLAGLAQLVNGTATGVTGAVNFSGKTITLDADIDLGEKAWTPIGTGASNVISGRISFSGTFDGQGYTIRGLNAVNATGSDCAGLFGCIGSGGTVKNLHVSGNVTGTINVGGVVGRNSGTVQDCSFSGTVTGGGSFFAYVGGVVGFNTSGDAVRNCYNTGKVIVNSGTNTYGGGVVGSNEDSTVSNCYNTGEVSGSTYAGGVAGGSSNSLGTTSKVENCYNMGTVSGRTFGGVVGDNSGFVTYCYYREDGDMPGIGDDGADYKQDTTPFTSASDIPIGTDGGLPADTWVMSESLGRPILISNLETREGVILAGDGLSADTAYQILNLETLEYYRDKINSDNGNYGSKYYKLTADIDLGGSSNLWTPIGNNYRVSFTGTFDGGGYTISGLYVTSGGNAGLFGYVGSGGVVRNVHVSGSVTGGDPYYGVGGVVGENDEGTVENCSFSGSVTSSATNVRIGGVVGANRGGTVKSCYNSADVSSTYDRNDMGGVVGYNNLVYMPNGIPPIPATVTDCYNTGNVSNRADNYSAGGVVGFNSSIVTNCYNFGHVSGWNRVGSVVGLNQEDTTNQVTDCYYLAGTASRGVGDGNSTTTSLTVGQFADESTFTNWDFTNTWTMDPGLGRPVLIACREAIDIAVTGDGLSDDTAFQIPDLATLEYFRNLINAGETYTVDSDQEQHPYASAYYKLTANINMSERYGANLSSWTPIGADDKHTFSGTFDGGNHTISNLYVNIQDEDGVYPAGLFGCVSNDNIFETTGSGATIKDLAVSGDVTAGFRVGGVVGQNYGGRVEGASFSGSVSGSVSNSQLVGGVVGWNNSGTVEDCSFSGSVTASDYVGGVVGQNYGVYEGLRATVSGCYNTGSVTGTGSYAYVGGVVGDNSASSGTTATVSGSYNTGNVSGARVGGVVGNNDSKILNCYNTGDVQGSEYAGGVVGLSEMENEDEPIAIGNCYNTGAVTGTGEGASVGGVVGETDEDSVVNCFYLAENESEDTGTGAGKTAEEFRSGQVAWLLQDGQAEVEGSKPQVWGQASLGQTGSLPQLTQEQSAQVVQVTFRNGGAVHAVRYTNYNSAVTLPAAPTPPDGQTFTGWFTAETGGEQVTDSTSVAEDAIYYAQFEAEPSTGGGSGGGSSTYPPTVTEPEGGDASVSPSRPSRGDEVTITPDPDEGFEVDEVTVTDRNGNPVDVTENRDGTYTFTQPSGRVTIEVTFRPAEPEPLPFTDVAAGSWYYDAVRYVYENGLMSGTSSAAFEPDAATSRGMVATILWRLAGSPAVNYLMDYEDVGQDAWYAEAVRWAASVGIVTGYGDGTFGPDDPVTREQLAVMLYQYAWNMGYDVTARADLSGYADMASISGWAEEAMSWAVGQRLISGKEGGVLDPAGQATRAQLAVMLQRFCEWSSER